MRSTWKSVLAKLLVAAMLVQTATGLVSDSVRAETSDPASVTESVYGAGSLPNSPLEAFHTSDVGSILDYKWTRVELSLSPDKREQAAMVYDPTAGNVVLFGGQGEFNLLDDTWIWDGEQQTWSEVLEMPGMAPLNPRPSARKAAAAAYDPNSGKMLLFGGEGAGVDEVLGDTWLWDGLTQSWQSLGTLPGPSARAGAQIAYDGDQLVLFGGYSLSGGGVRSPLGDTWLWDGNAWSQVSPLNSPPPMYFGGAAYDGQTAVIIGGNLGPVTRTHYGTTPDVSKDMTYEDPSSLLWRWDRQQLTWTSQDGPISTGRWGNPAAYDGRRVITLHGETRVFNYYAPRIPPFMIYEWKMPTNSYDVDHNIGKPKLAFGWTGSEWEPSWNGLGSTEDGILDVSKYPNDYEPWPHSWPSSRSQASMTFDGYRFMLFGGNLKEIKIRASFDDPTVVDVQPEGVSNETWLFGYTQPGPPSVRMEGEPFVAYDPTRVNDSVSVVTNVYGDGNRTITARGLEYRIVAESGTEPNEWTRQPYTGSSANTGSFTVSLTELLWQQEYEVRGYAVNELGTSYTEIARFTLTDHPNVEEPDVKYDRVGPSVLHTKDKMRLVAVGTGIFDLLRKPTGGINYYAEDENGVQYPLTYNVKDMRQLELFPEQPLPPGIYDIRLKHSYFVPYEFEDALLVTNLDFYKPRLFASVNVPSTSAQNKTHSLTLQGLFTEKPLAPNVYELTDPSEQAIINDTLLFTGSKLEVDKSGGNGKTMIRGSGRLYANVSGPAGTLPYTLLEGEWTISSDRFGFEIDQPESDYLNLGLPIRLQSADFTADGLRLNGELRIGFQAGEDTIEAWVPADTLIFRNNRFELINRYELDRSFKLGAFAAERLTVDVDSRYSHVGMTADAKLADTDLTFTLKLKTKQGRLDSFTFGSDKPAELGSAGLRVGYLYGQADGLASASSIPQQATTNGSVSDTIAPGVHMGGSQSYPMIHAAGQPIQLTPYGLTSEGQQNLVFLPLRNAWMIGVANPKTGFTQGFSIPGFRTQGELNAYGIIEGLAHFAGNERDGIGGRMKATIRVPQGIPQIGGATVNGVQLTIEAGKMYGSFRYNNVGVTLLYTFHDNTILFDLKQSPPKPPAWMTGFEIGFNTVSMSRLLDKSALEVRMLAAIAATMNLTQTGKTTQPSAQSIRTGMSARIAEGKLTAYRQDLTLRSELNAADDGSGYRLPVKLPHTGWIVLSGDQRDAAISGPAADANTNSAAAIKEERHYQASSDTTYIRAELNRVGEWLLTTKRPSSVAVHELLYANSSLDMEELAEAWENAAESQVTAVTVEESGAFWLEVEAGADEPLLVKPDGRPYRVQANETEPDWNTVRGNDGALSVLLESARPGTWLIVSGQERDAVLYRVPGKTEMSDARQWTESDRYPTGFSVARTDNNQAIVEVYGANEQTKLHRPDGQLYALQLQQSSPDWNAVYDADAAKLTVLLEGGDLAGDWKVTGERFADVVVYKANRKLDSPQAQQVAGERTIVLELPEAGNYVLALSGAGTDTVITAPGGQAFPLVFDEQSPERNAVIQLQRDRLPASGSSGANVAAGENAISDTRDTLYVTLQGAAAGKWTIRTQQSVAWEIRELTEVPEFTQATVSAGNAAGSQLRLEWNVSPAAPDAEVEVMLTDNAERPIGERVATGLPASGRTVVALPEGLVPGDYRVVLIAKSEAWPSVHTLAEGTVTVKSHASLSAPGQPVVQSVGNGEVTLAFPSATGPVTSYRVWASAGGELNPIFDFAPIAGSTQKAVIAGLPVGQTHTLAVSALADDGGRLSASPLSSTVEAELPAPRPAAVSLALDGGGAAVKQKAYTAYDGSAETLLATASGQAALQVTADQDIAVTVSVDGKTSSAKQATAGSAATFALHELLETAQLSERVYDVTVEARNAQGDRTIERVKLLIDRTAPLLAVSNGMSSTGQLQPLNGLVVNSSHLYIVGQTDPGAKLTLDGETVPLDDYGKFGYNATMSWDEAEGRKMAVLIVEDEAGNKKESHFEILRGQSGSLPSVSMSLKALTVEGAKMANAYQPAATFYMAVPMRGQVRVRALAANEATAVTIDGQAVGSDGYADITVPPTGKLVTVAVQSGYTYTLQLSGYRDSIAALQSLELRDASGGPTADVLPAAYFTGAEAGYTVYVERNVDSVTVTPAAVLPGATITVAGQAVVNGQASAPISVQTGDNTIDIIVTAPDQTTTKTYRITVERAKDGNARLLNLELSGAAVQLQPAFTPEVREYRVAVPHGTTSLSVLAETDQPETAVRINGQLAASGTSHQVTMGASSSTLLIQVEAEDGTERTYRIAVTQLPADPGAPPRLSALEIAGGKLDAEFSPYRRVYRAGTTSQATVVVTATANDPDAIVTVNDELPGRDGKFAAGLANGENLLVIQVESPDGRTAEAYSVAIERQRVSGGSSGAPAGGVSERTVNAAGENGAWTIPVPIVRTSTEQGRVIDTLKLDGAKAKSIADKAGQSGHRAVYLRVDDLPANPADERLVRLDADAVQSLADGKLTLVIELPEGQIMVDEQSLVKMGQAAREIYWRVVPIRASAEREEVGKRARGTGNGMVLVGSPVRIETNYSGFTTGLVFPLSQLKLPQDSVAAAKLLSQLAVYIEHSDGETVLKRGEVQYDAQGVAELAIEIDKFSTFAVVRETGDAADGWLEPYLSGYPDGTFRPERSVTRAELAAMLYRLLGLAGDRTTQEQVAQRQTESYQDVSASHWASVQIAAMQREGVMLGDPNRRFRPDAYVTRAEIAVIGARLKDAARDAAGPARKVYLDVEGHWASAAIQLAWTEGWMLGYPDGTFRPDKPLTRAETVKTINRLTGRPVSTGRNTSSWPDVQDRHWALADIESASMPQAVTDDGAIEKQ